MLQLVVQLLVISPLLNRIFESRKHSRQQKIAYALAVIFGVSLAASAYEYMGQPPTLYSLLESDVNASPAELKRQYLTLSVKLHPDKNPSPTAEQDFVRVKCVGSPRMWRATVAMLCPLFPHCPACCSSFACPPPLLPSCPCPAASSVPPALL